jgi:hypothetical protein
LLTHYRKRIERSAVGKYASFVRSLAMILYLRQAKRGNVPYLNLLAWGKMMSIAVLIKLTISKSDLLFAAWSMFLTRSLDSTRFKFLSFCNFSAYKIRSCYKSYTSKINLEKINQLKRKRMPLHVARWEHHSLFV